MNQQLLDEITKLADKASAENEKYVSSILYALAGAYVGGDIEILANGVIVIIKEVIQPRMEAKKQLGGIGLN